MMGVRLLTACACLSLAGVAAAQPLPALSGPVNDFAQVIDAGSATELDRRIRSLEQATGDAVVVVTVKSVAPYAGVEEYAVRLFENAGIGKRGQDNGVLVLLAVSERRVRIEVGYGLEEYVTDGFSGEVIRRDMLPAFRDDRFGEGLLAGTTRIIRRIAEGRGKPLADMPAPEPVPDIESPSMLNVVIGIFLVLMILRAISRGGTHVRRRRRWPGHPWSGGGFGGFGGGIGGGFGGFGGGWGGGGGFGGFGGGRSGGGGASGGW
jgi:uncharacterized protein